MPQKRKKKFQVKLSAPYLSWKHVWLSQFLSCDPFLKYLSAKCFWIQVLLHYLLEFQMATLRMSMSFCFILLCVTLAYCKGTAYFFQYTFKVLQIAKRFAKYWKKVARMRRDRRKKLRLPNVNPVCLGCDLSLLL